MALDCMQRVNMEPVYFIDAHSREQNFHNIPVIHPADISEHDKKTFTFIVCIATLPYVPIKKFLQELGCAEIYHFYDLSEAAFPQIMPNGWMLEAPNKTCLKSIFTSLSHDETSAAHFLQFLWWRIAREEKIYEDYPVLTGQKYFKAPCIPPASKKEFLIDCGVHAGQTIAAFKQYTKEQFIGVHGFEPDPQMYTIATSGHLEDNIKIESLAVSDTIKKAPFRSGLDFASSLAEDGVLIVQTTTIDCLQGAKPTFIKVHVEGAELAVLKGGKNCIEKHRPILMVFADHSPDGLKEIPQFLISLEKYKLYFYLHDYCGNSAIFYAIPQ